VLTGIHLLLTYKCTQTCDHCFLYSSPDAEGTMTIGQVADVLDQAQDLGTVDWIYFEGGEPFLFAPVLTEGVRLARRMGFETGVVSNAYWATSEADAELWLRPLAELGLGDLSLSDDDFHNWPGGAAPPGAVARPAAIALAAARRLGIPVAAICIEKPFVEASPGEGQGQGQPVIGGGALFKGRAVEKLAEGLPRRPWAELTSCPHEDLRSPSRAHVDAFGHVHLCQGLTLGNLWHKPLAELVAGYDPDSHPVAGPLLKGGPALLAADYGLSHEEGYVDECHFCYLMRRALLERLPETLAPRQVYGLEAQ
jgi:hypothetical protein